MKYHDDNMPGSPEWDDNADQPFNRMHPLEVYIEKETLAGVVEAQIAVIERGRAPIIESEEETTFVEGLLTERRQLVEWVRNYPQSHVFVQLYPQSEFAASPPKFIH